MTSPPPSPLIAFTALYHDGKMIFESTPVAANAIPDTRLSITPFRFDIGIAALPVGEYQCQVTVLDPAGPQASFLQGNITIAP